MSKSKLFILQFSFILQVALICGLVVMRYFPKSLVGAEPKEIVPVLSPLADDFFATRVSEEKIYVPERVSFPSIAFDLPVAPASIIADEWTLFPDKASWLTTSSPLGVGNTILYAHNRAGLFGDLKNLELGKEIVISSYGKEFHYEISQMRKVEPDEIDAILSDQHQLTLYTCDGRFDEKRLVVIANPI